MLLIKRKVCGMKDKDNILEIALLRPDFMGFIFYVDSPRYVGVDFQIPAELDVAIKRVGVFVNEDETIVESLVNTHGLDFVQLHGDETIAQCERFKKKGIGVIKVFAMDDEFDFFSLAPFESVVDYFLFDTKGKLRGGNNKTFDWKILEKYSGSIPFFLSGGINPNNVDTIAQLKHENLFAIDVNSGVEDSPGVKNKMMLQKLMNRFNKVV